MKKVILKTCLAGAALALSACATVPVITAKDGKTLDIGANHHTVLNQTWNELQTTGNAYVQRSDTLKRNGRGLNAFSTLGAIGTVAVSAFDGGATAIAATAIGTQSFNAFQTNLKPTSRAVAYAQGANALACVAERSQLIDPFVAHNRSLALTSSDPLEFAAAIYEPSDLSIAAGVISFRNFSRSPSYTELAQFIDILLSKAGLISDPIPELEEAVKNATDAKDRLQSGINAQNTLAATTRTTFQQISKAVNEATSVDIAALLESLSKIEISDGEETEPVDMTDAAAGAAQLKEDAEDAVNEQLILIQLINLSVSHVNYLTPEQDAEILKQLVQCATIVTGGP